MGRYGNDSPPTFFFIKEEREKREEREREREKERKREREGVEGNAFAFTWQLRTIKEKRSFPKENDFLWGGVGLGPPRPASGWCARMGKRASEVEGVRRPSRPQRATKER